jgi:hypothetical protein
MSLNDGNSEPKPPVAPLRAEPCGEWLIGVSDSAQAQQHRRGTLPHPCATAEAAEETCQG